MASKKKFDFKKAMSTPNTVTTHILKTKITRPNKKVK